VCCNLVCEQLPLCCIVEWNEDCVAVANDLCEPPPPCPGEGSCLEPHEGPGCEQVACCELVCQVDVFCCEGVWDQLCADEAARFCAADGCSLPACPPIAMVEPESTDCYDRANDGCNLAVPAFTSIACGDVICGSTWTVGSRDTDWYEITLDEPAELAWTVNSEFPSEIFIVSGACDDRFTVVASAFGGGCQLASARVAAEAGTYYLYVAPGIETGPINRGIGCMQDGEPTEDGVFGGRYFAFVTCGPGCTEDLNGDNRVGIADFLLLLAAWGQSQNGPPDFDGDGVVGISDMTILFGAWGPCP
jgi:hypothetical protein